MLFAQAALLPVEERVRGTARIPSREQCEMILMVGLPSAGQQFIRSGSLSFALRIRILGHKVAQIGTGIS